MPLPAITYRTTGAWGAGKGSKLTSAEVDNNFWEIAQDIRDLQDNPVDPNEITAVNQVGNQIYFVLADGTQFGPITLPRTLLRWRDEWTANTQYFENDLVRVTGTGIFVLLQDFISGSTFDADDEESGGPVYFQIFGADINSIYDFSLRCDAVPEAGETVDRIPITRNITIPANFSGSVASGGVAPDDFSGFVGYVFSVKDDGTTIGTITVDENGTVTFATTSGTAKSVAAGSVLTLVAPDDGTDQDIAITGWVFGIAARVAS